MSLIQTLKRIHLILLCSGITVISVVAACIFTNAYLKTPSFLFQLGTDLEENKALIHSIGGNRGTIITFNPEEMVEGDTADFSVQIQGKCDSTYVKIRGVYSKTGDSWKYVIQDTLQINQCP